MIVVDTSFVLVWLLDHEFTGDELTMDELHAPSLLDYEIAYAVREHVRSNQLTPDDGWALLENYRLLGIIKHSVLPQFERVWALRHNLPRTTRPMLPWRSRSDAHS